jgi:arginine/lysine/ornithine decarboxylase
MFSPYIADFILTSVHDTIKSTSNTSELHYHQKQFNEIYTQYKTKAPDYIYHTLNL